MKLKRQLLKNSIFVLIFVLLVYGCSARKTAISINKTETEKTEVVKSDVKTDEKSEVIKIENETTKSTESSESTKNNVTTDSEVNITIEPNEGETWSVYDFVVGNTVFKGTSQGKITFSNKLKIDSINEAVKVVKDVQKEKVKDSTAKVDKKIDEKVDSKKTEKVKEKVKVKIPQ